MRTNREIFAHAYLLSASLAMAILGGTSLLLAPLFAPPTGLGALIAPAGALGATLTGVGFLASTQSWHRTRLIVGGLLAFLGALALSRGMGLAVPWPGEIDTVGISTPTAVLFVLLGVYFLPRPDFTQWRRPRQILGCLSLAGGAMLMLTHWVFGFRLESPINPVAAPMLGLYGILSGGTILVLSRRNDAPVGSLQSLDSRTVVAGTVGILLTCLLWYVMGVQHFRTLDQQASRVSDSFEVVLQQTVRQHTLLIQRLAQRFNAAADEADMSMAEADAASYVWDVPGIRAVGLSDGRQELIWQTSRDGNTDLAQALDNLTDSPESAQAPTGLAATSLVSSRVRFVQLPNVDWRGALISFPVILQSVEPGQMVALIDLQSLMQSQLAGALSPFALRVSIDGDPFMTLIPDGQPLTENFSSALLRSHTAQIYGQILSVEVIHLNPRMLAFTPNLLFGVAMLGFVLSFFVVLTIEQSRFSARGARTLRQTLQRLTHARQIQEQIGRDVALSSTLDSITRLVESYVPGTVASVMLRRPGTDTLYLAAGARLPARFRAELTQIPIASDEGSCGTAAYLGQAVITDDIEHDDRWLKYRDFMREIGFRACWSHPLLDTQGAVIGTLAIYREAEGIPTPEAVGIIEDARNLLMLSLERHRMLRSLERNEQRYGSLFRENPEVVLSLNSEGWIADVNSAATRLFGMTEVELIHRPLADLLSPESAEKARHSLALALSGRPQRFEATTQGANGKIAYCDITELPIIVDGEVEGVFCIAKDTTKRKEHLSQLQLLRRSVDASINGIVIADARQPGYPVTFINPTFTEITGYTEAEMLGQSCRILQGENTSKAAVEHIREALHRREEVHITLRNYRKDGEPFWNDLYISPVEDDNGECTHFIGVQKDISDQMSQEAELAFHASHDALTGLPNRSLLEDRLLQACEQAKRQGHQVVVLFIDLDGFKPVNDSLGHGVGDRVLIEVAKRLEGRVRAGDTLARFGGDEFVAVLNDVTSAEEAIPVIERILEVVARPYRADHLELTITASIGATINDGHITQATTLIQEADMAMYKAKSQGRNQYQWYTEDINERLGRRVRLRNELQEAIDQNGLELHYQPLISNDGAVVSFEALLRWKHPEHGYISPADFIPLAEETGQILPISDWVLQQACADLVTLRERGDFRISINLSPLQFHRTGFFEALQATLSCSGLPPDALILELTEGILLDQTSTAIELLQKLRAAGIGVAIDDFGTGFSSLSYLKNLPVSSVKIDRSFIEELTTNEHDAAITHSVIDMAHRLHLQVVAEGVETADQRERLLAFKCDVLQGYYFARPMPLCDLSHYLDNH